MSLGLLARDSMINLSAVGSEDAEFLSPRSSSSSLAENDRKEHPPSPLIPASELESLNINTGHHPPESTSGTSQGQDASSVGAAQARGAGLASVERKRLSAGTTEREANPQQPPSFQYAGYSDDYYYDAHNGHENYALDFTASKKGEKTGMLFCLFPWLHQQPHKIIHQQVQSSALAVPVEEPASNNEITAPASEEDAESRDGESTSNSNFLGERLSEKNRQAVLARLRLAQPESTVQQISTTEHQGEQEESLNIEGAEKNKNKKGLLNGIPVYDTSPLEESVDGDCRLKLKGILKMRASSKSDDRLMEQGMVSRLSSYGDPNTSVASNGGSGNATASQQTGRHRRSLFPSYEDKGKPRTTNSVVFSPMARVITVKSKNDMADEEKADVWWQRSDYEDFRKTGRIITRAMMEGGSEIWLATDKKRAHLPDESAASDKWWHKFGHSRRGLEHVVSIDEGRQRQITVKTAIRAVIEEQSRQKMYKREDPERLRAVALHHTSWARDLALASGSSDEDAVESSFATGRRSREFFLLKMSRNKPTNGVKSGQRVPPFMQPATHQNVASSGIANTSIVQQHLDAHTAAQIQFRRQKNNVDTVVATQQPENDEESVTDVHDPGPDDKSKESMAQKAAGFSADGEKVNMAAVLSGMGAVPSQKDE